MRWLMLAVLLLCGCGGGGAGGSAAALPPVGSSQGGAAAASPIKHVVIIIQENHSFDNFFHAFPGAESTESGLDHNNNPVQLHQISLFDTTQFDIDHTHSGFIADYNNGALNGFDHGTRHGYTQDAFAYVNPADIAPYWTLASQYTLADHMFQSNTGASFVAHQYLIAGQANNAVDIPYIPNTNIAPTPWGCDSPPSTVIDELDTHGNVAQSAFPCFSYDTLATLLDRKSISWKFYAPAIGRGGDFGQVWSAFDAIDTVRHGADWSNVSSPESNILTDAATGHLPQVSWVVPSENNSDHPGDGAGGPAWVATVVNAIGQSPYWKDTAIFIVWDDWGGWYDHVSPPQLDVNGLGFRVPMIAVSPYAKKHNVSKTQYEFASILRFVEDTFSLGTIGSTDLRARSVIDCFDFTQSPSAYTPLAGARSVQSYINELPSAGPPDDD